MRILTTGAAGFIGRNLAKHFQSRSHWSLGTTKDMLNIGSEESIRHALTTYKPDVLVNCAGTKDLQGCEDDPVRAMQLNAFAPAALARVCREVGVRFVHIGSDHAYGTPETQYGLSKLAGDKLVMEANPSAIVAVTGHVYAADCPWVKWLDGELRAGRTVDAWGDIFNWPTYLPDLGDAILRLVDPTYTRYGVYGCVGPVEVNRVELFRAYARAVECPEWKILRSPEPCPSKLHPRRIVVPNRPWGQGLTVDEGMRMMCQTLKQVAAA